MKLNRRQFLGSAAATAAVVAAPAGVAEAAVVEKKTDLVIIGAGLGGLAAGFAGSTGVLMGKRG